MSSARHVCWGDSASGCLKQRNYQLGVSNPVIRILDDFRIGSLVDAELPMPKLRRELFKQICGAQWWYSRIEYEASLLQNYSKYHRQLLQILAEPDPVVVWLGNNARDKLMMAMIAHLAAPSTPLAIIDITGQVDCHHNGEFDLAFCQPESLLHLSPVEISTTARAELAETWRYWRIQARGWREIGSNGDIVDYPLDYFDNILLSNIECSKPRVVTEIVSSIINSTPGLIPVSFLLWRLQILNHNNKLVFIPVDGPIPQAPLVSIT